MIFYSDSGVHTVTAPSIPIAVLNATTVNFTGFGGARGFNRGQSGGSGIIQGDNAVESISGSTINFDGNNLTGGDGTTFGAFGGITAGGHGLTLNDSAATVSGGLLQGGNARSSGTGIVRGGNGLNLAESTLVINGGTFSHGVGTRIGSTGITSDGVSIRAIADSVIDLLGGVFTAEILLSDSILNVFGTNLMFDGETLTGNLQNGGDTSIEIDLLGTSQVILNNAVEIPAPGTLAIFVIGLMALNSRRARNLPRTIPTIRR